MSILRVITILLTASISLGGEIAAETKDMTAIFSRVASVSNAYKNNDIKQLIVWITRNNKGAMVEVEVLNVITDKESVSMAFYKKDKSGVYIYANVILEYAAEGILTGYYEELDIGNGIYYNIIVDFSEKGIPLSLEIGPIGSKVKQSTGGSGQWKWQNEEMTVAGNTAVLKNLPNELLSLSVSNGINKTQKHLLSPPKCDIVPIANSIKTLCRIIDMKDTDAKLEMPPMLQGKKDVFCRTAYSEKGLYELKLATGNPKSQTGFSGYTLKVSEGKIMEYIEGDIEINNRMVMKDNKMYIITGTSAFEWSGKVVTFHPTGYPATYKTIVKGNLFGRQMEWNDKGEVISDIDLDIPTAQKQKPVQKEKPVMRTWTSRGGKHTLQAQYISADENQVVLGTEKDGEVVVKLSELSDEDRAYVKKQRE